eukprot:1446847-Rhodomonas_salina.2
MGSFSCIIAVVDKGPPHDKLAVKRAAEGCERYGDEGVWMADRATSRLAPRHYEGASCAIAMRCLVLTLVMPRPGEREQREETRR